MAFHLSKRMSTAPNRSYKNAIIMYEDFNSGTIYLPHAYTILVGKYQDNTSIVTDCGLWTVWTEFKCLRAETTDELFRTRTEGFSDYQLDLTNTSSNWLVPVAYNQRFINSLTLKKVMLLARDTASVIIRFFRRNLENKYIPSMGFIFVSG